MSLERTGSTLDEIDAHLSAVYGRRNALVLHSLAQRVQFLILGLKDMQDAIRKEAQENEGTTGACEVPVRTQSSEAGAGNSRYRIAKLKRHLSVGGSKFTLRSPAGNGMWSLVGRLVKKLAQLC